MMERKFYTDNFFEKLLKENADQFKMYPSKKVWHGLYNDLHPGKRWPSITMSILFLFSLVIIGHLNTGNNHRQQQTAGNLQPTKQLAAGSRTASSHPSNHLTRGEDYSSNEPDEMEVPEQSSTDNLIQTNTGQINIVNTTDPNQTANSEISSTTTTPSSAGLRKPVTQNGLSADESNKNILNHPASASNSKVNDNIEVPSVINNDGSAVVKTDIAKQQVAFPGNDANLVNTNIAPALVTDQQVRTVKTQILAANIKKQDNKKIETSTTALSIISRIKKKNISWTYYISPSVSYRNVFTPPLSNTVVLNAPVISPNTNNNNVKQYPSVGLEAGGAVNYKLFKKVQFVTGIQLNYSRYHITANHTHPTMASLFLNSETTGTPYSLTAISIYGNGTSTGQFAEVTLHNYSFEASLPIGLQYELFGNDKIKLNAVATFQPSFIIANQSYILSTDKRNYLTDQDLVRKWNMNTNFGTYISFKTNTLNWQIGPQIRYHLLSTYIPNYPGKEHLVDYGVRFGVSKIIK